MLAIDFNFHAHREIRLARMVMDRQFVFVPLHDFTIFQLTIDLRRARIDIRCPKASRMIDDVCNPIERPDLKCFSIGEREDARVVIVVGMADHHHFDRADTKVAIQFVHPGDQILSVRIDQQHRAIFRSQGVCIACQIQVGRKLRPGHRVPLGIRRADLLFRQEAIVRRVADDLLRVDVEVLELGRFLKPQGSFLQCIDDLLANRFAMLGIEHCRFLVAELAQRLGGGTQAFILLVMPFGRVGRPHFSGGTQRIAAEADHSLAFLARGDVGNVIFTMARRGDNFQFPIAPLERTSVVQIKSNALGTRWMNKERPIAPVAMKQRRELARRYLRQ